MGALPARIGMKFLTKRHTTIIMAINRDVVSVDEPPSWRKVNPMHIPDAVFIYLSYARPESLSLIGACVALEQFGYGFGFTAYMLYLIYISRGQHSTAHYAICTGFMALGLMLPGMWSRKLQEWLGYQHFFIWVMLATIPGFIVTALIPLDAAFGRKAAG